MGQLYYAQTQLYSIVLGVKFSGQYDVENIAIKVREQYPAEPERVLPRACYCVHLSRVTARRPTPPTRVDQLFWALVENLREEPKKMSSEKE